MENTRLKTHGSLGGLQYEMMNYTSAPYSALPLSLASLNQGAGTQELSYQLLLGMLYGIKAHAPLLVCLLSI